MISPFCRVNAGRFPGRAEGQEINFLLDTHYWGKKPKGNTLMNAIVINLEATRASLREMAAQLAREFMANRTQRRPSREEWSDLVVKVDTVGGYLRVEWRRRIWFGRSRGKTKRGYYSKYVSTREVMRYAKEFEREEVELTRNRLQALKEAHADLRKLERRFDRLGLTLDEPDRLIGFMPEGLLEPRDRKGRFSRKRKPGERHEPEEHDLEQDDEQEDEDDLEDEEAF